MGKPDPAIAEAVFLRQNMPGAWIGALLGFIFALCLWEVISRVHPAGAPFMLAGSGVLIGLGVRFLGEGYARRFRLVAVMMTVLVQLVSVFVFGYDITGGMTVFAVLIFGVAVAGWISAFSLSVARLNDQEARAVHHHLARHPYREPRRRNSWLATIAWGVPAICIALVCSVVVAVFIRPPEFWQEIAQMEYSPPTHAPQSGRAAGRAMGEYFSADECSDLAARRLRDCMNDNLCVAENPHFLAGCQQRAREVGNAGHGFDTGSDSG